MNATLRRDRSTGRLWLEFPGKPDAATIAALKAGGWRWGSFRSAWFNVSRFAKVPAGIAYDDGGEVDYAAERAERLEERAEKAGSRAAAAFGRAHTIADGIPFGQPILVGHGSERRARRDQDKIHSAMSKGCAEQGKAERLAQAASGSARAERLRHDPGVIDRRLKKLRKDLAAYERTEPMDEARVARFYEAIRTYRPADWSLEQAGAELAERVEERARRATILREEIARNEAELAEAGGLPVERLQFGPGDIIRVKGHVAKVVRVNRTTVSVESGFSWPLKYDLSFVQEVVKRAALIPAPVEAPGQMLDAAPAPAGELTPGQKAARTRRERREAAARAAAIPPAPVADPLAV